MPLDKSVVKHIAYLARITVTENEAETLAGELDHIIGWIEQLNEVETDGVQPMTSVADMTLPERADEVTDGQIVDKVLANATDLEDGFFTVPKVIE